MATTSEAGLEALHRLRETDPAQWLAGTSTLTQTARAASRQLFSSLRPFTPKSPFDQLLVDGFDAEQIWQQIDLQTQPLLSNLRRELKRFEKNPEEIGKLKLVGQGKEKVLEDREVELGEERDGFDEELDDFDVDDDDDDDDEEEDEEEGGEERESEREEEEEEGNGGDGIEDKFLKIKDLEDFLEDDEAREYGLKKKDKKKEDKKQSDDGLDDEDEDEDEEEDGNAEESEDEEDEDSDENGEFGFGDDEEEETDELGNARYEDFFGGKKKKPSKKSKSISNSENSDTDDQEEGDKTFENQKQKNLSKHEKELKKIKSEIDQMEKANLEPKDWTMQGEVTAAKRPKNSALEVDLDFEHNVRPPPVITEEITESIEKMIQRRIARGLFDDVQKAPTLPSKAPKEFKELDENKSKKGLAEVYEEKYFQETNAAYAPTSFTDELKKEASELFKKLCLKLDALSHFHFTPKPVIEDMAVQVNVPALAMEEIAPVAVSDAAMLAPEEVFAGKGDVKEDAELTQADRKRRRAKKKRKFKADAAKRTQSKGQDSILQSYDDDDKEDKKRKL